ncbi:minichromosome maintenance protein MCM [Haloterrigena salifodinae]|uniref:DNA helicase n=1 Tax=Haloterrigena salifodinae TaxID=2675099 RepID=A0A8T8DX92_9EURY|nr:minichromosome maintenance protein MCM [Haloterrigena salifodinae]QRV14194.1 minichromosome maintenance protein MCM [Haloterrigena salifodinae]
MAQTQAEDDPLTDRLATEFYRRYYKDEIGQLAQKYPTEQRSLEVDWNDIYRSDPDVADDYLMAPEQMRRYFEEALRMFDLSIDITLDAHVRVGNLPEEYTFYPGEFSPSEHLGAYRSIRGEITKATDVYPKIEEAAFECELCRTLTRVPQSDGNFQEPHECQGCERQGPFRVNFDQSEFVDAQKLRVKVPPELADGAGQKLDAFVEDDLAGKVTIGDRVVVSGTIHFEQETSGKEKKPKFEPYLTGDHIEIEETDQQDLDITSRERTRIRELSDGAEGQPLEVASESLAPKIYGYEIEKKALILALVSGGQIKYPTGDADRADVHVLLLGDPGTAKSKLIDRAQQLGWRTVGVSSKRATIPGLTAAAEQDDFGDGEWVMKAGAFVKANGGTVCIDELDDMSPDTRAGMLEPMSKQRFSANLAGESVTFQTEASVVAAGNPRDGRFNPYEPVPEQFAFDSALISRFDLVFTMRDEPDEEEDRDIADHILASRDAAKRGDWDDLEDDDVDRIKPPVEGDILQKWIALARQRATPPFASKDVRHQLRDKWLELRGMYNYDENEPIPVTFRSLEGLTRVCEALAKLEFYDEIHERHVNQVLEIVGRSMDDIGKNEDGELDADIQEVGQSKDQRSRRKTVAQAINDLEEEYSNGVPRDSVVEYVREDLDHDYAASKLQSDMEKFLQEGEAIEPQTDHIRYLGRLV